MAAAAALTATDAVARAGTPLAACCGARFSSCMDAEAAAALASVRSRLLGGAGALLLLLLLLLLPPCSTDAVAA